MKSMEELLNSLSSIPQLAFLSNLKKEFDQAEFFLVGGALRDWFLERQTPQTDYDFVVRALPLESLVAWLQKHGEVNIVGKTFGVIKFTPKGTKEEIDIALPRTEQTLPNSQGGYRDISVQSDPNLPIEKDLARRDFTINAMALNLHSGELIDPFGGQHDIEAHVLSAVGYAKDRFEEDLTRILRGLRFAVELNFTIEPETQEAMKTLVPRLNQINKTNNGSIFVVSRETIGDELSKAFFADPNLTVQLLEDLGALEEMFPSVWRHLQLNAHYLEPVIHTNKHELERAIILLLRDLTQDEARTTLSFTGLDTIQKNSPRRIDAEHILWMIQKLQQHLTPENISTMRASHFEKQFLGLRGEQHKHLLEHLGHHAVAEAAHKRKKEICERWKCEDYEPIPPLVTGDDVLRLGIPAGTKVREILELVRDHQLDGDLLTRESAIKFIKQHME